MNAISRNDDNLSCKRKNNVSESESVIQAADSQQAACYAIPETPRNQVGWGGARSGAGRKAKPKVTPAQFGLRWYVVKTFPQAEWHAAHDLARQGWSHYLPLIAVRKRDPVMPSVFRKTLVPLFPGYLFVEFDRDGMTWGTIRNNCAGVRNIIRGADGRPYPLDPALVPGLRDADTDRLELASLAKPARVCGEMVQVRSGPFSGTIAQVFECDGFTTTVRVFLFGRENLISLPWDDLVAA